MQSGNVETCGLLVKRTVRRHRTRPLLVIPRIEPLAGPKFTQTVPARRTSNHVGWGLGGFFLGVAFWHMIGVWSFVTTEMRYAQTNYTTVVAGEPAAQTVKHDTVHPSRASSETKPTFTPATYMPATAVKTGFRDQDVTRAQPADELAGVASTGAPQNCTELYLDPMTGLTGSRPCSLRPGLAPEDQIPFQTAQRGDIVQQ